MKRGAAIWALPVLSASLVMPPAPRARGDGATSTRRRQLAAAVAAFVGGARPQPGRSMAPPRGNIALLRPILESRIAIAELGALVGDLSRRTQRGLTHTSYFSTWPSLRGNAGRAQRRRARRAGVRMRASGRAPRRAAKGVARRGKTCSTRPSLVFPDRGTTRARTCLTSLFEWEAVTQADMAACICRRCHV